MKIYIPTCKTLDPNGCDYIDLPVGTQSYMTEEEAQNECAEGCEPFEVELPPYLNHVIQRGFDDMEGDDGREPDPRDAWIADLENRASKGDEEAIFALQNL